MPGDVEGCFAICCSEPCVQAVTASMLALEPGSPFSDNDIIDVVGEIANMIMGGIKTRVQPAIAHIEISIPSVLHGRQLQNRLGEAMTRIGVPVTIAQQHHAELSRLLRQRVK